MPPRAASGATIGDYATSFVSERERGAEWVGVVSVVVVVVELEQGDSI